MLDPHRLQIFRAVAAAGSIAGAARSLGYTSSAVSQHVTALQRETGLTLVQRSGRGLRITDIGQRFAARCGELLVMFDALDATVADLRHHREGRLVISYVSSVGLTWIPAVLASLVAEFPSVRIELRLADVGDTADMDADLGIDVATKDGHSSASQGYHAIPLLDDPYVVAVQADHRIARCRDVALRELQGERWIENEVAPGPCRQIVLDACASAGYTPAFHLQAVGYPYALEFVRAGLGVTVLPALAARVLPPGVVTLPIVDPTPTRTLRLQVRSSLSTHPAALRCAYLLREAATKDGRPAEPHNTTAGTPA